MTDKEKLQRLFDAALKDSSEVSKAPTRAFPTAVAEAAVPAPVSPVAMTVLIPASPSVVVIPEADAAKVGLTAEASAELGALLDEQMARKKRKHRREALVTLGVFLAITGGGFGWFVQSPQRVQAFTDAMRDIRSVGDVASMVAKYQAALDKVAVRSKQIDQATESMGVSSDQSGEEDPNMEAEMLAMMGGQGKTTGQRNQVLQQSFGGMKDKHGAKTDKPEIKIKEEDSFGWNR